MQAHKFQIVVPEDHRAILDFLSTIPAGPVEVIVLVPARESVDGPIPGDRREQLRGLLVDLESDPRPLKELSPEERRIRFERLRGAFRGTTSGSEGLALLKREEVEIEDAKFAR